MKVVARSIAGFCVFVPLAASGQPLPTTPPAPADLCLGIQGDAEYLRRQVEDSIKNVRDALFFQREEDASALAFQDQCKGREDTSPQCRLIAIDLAARASLRKQSEPKVQALTATLQYYRSEYDQANLDLYRCRDMVETEKQLKAAPDPDKPPVDPNQPTLPSDTDTDQQRKQTANAGGAPPDPNQPDTPANPEPGPPGPKPIGDPGSRTADPYLPTPAPDPNTLERERDRVYQPPVVAVLPPYDPGPDLRPPNNIGEPYARGPRGRDRKIGSRLGVPGDSSAPRLTPSDGGPDGPTRQPPDANTTLITDTCDWAAQQTDPAALSAREEKLHTIQADGFKKKAAAEGLVTNLTDKLNAQIATLNLDKAAKKAPEVTGAQQAVVDTVRSQVETAQRDLDGIKTDNLRQRLLPVAISCIVSRKASLAKQGKVAPPKPPADGACNAPNAQYQCVYMEGGAAAVSMGSASGVASMVMSVCVPPNGFASASCSVDTIRPGAATTSDPIRTSCTPPKDQAAFAQQCKDLRGRLVTPKQQLAKAMPDVAPSPETAVGDPEKPAPPAPEIALGSPAKEQPAKQDPPAPETAIGDPEKPKPKQPEPHPKAAAPEPAPAPPPSTSAAAPTPQPAPDPAPHINVVTLPPPPPPEPPHTNVVTLPDPPELGPPEMTPGPHVNRAAPTPAPAPSQPHVNIYEKPAQRTPPAPLPPLGGSSSVSGGSCDTKNGVTTCTDLQGHKCTTTTGFCDPRTASAQPQSGAPTPPADPKAGEKKAAAVDPKPAPKPLPPEKVAAAAPKIEPAPPAQKPLPKEQPKPLPPAQVAAAAPKIEPAPPAQKPEPKALPPAQLAAATPKVEPAPPAQKPQPKALPPAQVAAATPKVEPAPPAQTPQPKALPPATAPSPAQANNAPVQPAEPAKPAVKPSCSRAGITFNTSRGDSRTIAEKAVGGAACSHAYTSSGNSTYTGISISQHPSNGTLTQNDATHFRYQPRAGFRGSDRYVIRACATSNGKNGCSILTYLVTVE